MRISKESDIDWIFANWSKIRETPSNATMNELMRRVGIDDPWDRRGPHNVGIVWCQNAEKVHRYLDSSLTAGDRERFDELCEEAQKQCRP